ncbi:tetratricopeptide repeat protein [Primorskyibacter sp. 2E107]|uniref:tetratricopeptide repeat protein n=1 Tax=Primorskyibacter sp. 2E107 TaxID=3403458 RepID=UPI003AF86C57
MMPGDVMRLRFGSVALCLCLAALPAVAQQADPWVDADLAQVQAASDQGIAAAQYALARRLEVGDGVLQNYALAAEWFARAAKQGNAAAAHRLGQYYFAGLGVDQNRDAALAWLEAAAETGAAQYLYDLGVALETGTEAGKDLTRAAEVYQKAADLGHAEAQVSLGVLYQNGKGVPKDLDRARTLYEGPAEAGHARAQNNLGLLYVRGEGVPQDYNRAFSLFEAASDQGLAVALRNLGVMYENGFGVAVDEALAHELYRRAARDGKAPGDADAIPAVVFDPRLAAPDTSEEGLKRLQNGVRAGDPVALFTAGWLLMQDEGAGYAEFRQAAGLFHASALAGNAAAMTNLALLYFDGRVVPQDYALGYMWLVLAGTAGFPPALDLSATLASRMTPGQIAEAQQMAQARAGR